MDKDNNPIEFPKMDVKEDEGGGEGKDEEPHCSDDKEWSQLPTTMT